MQNVSPLWLWLGRVQDTCPAGWGSRRPAWAGSKGPGLRASTEPAEGGRDSCAPVRSNLTQGFHRLCRVLGVAVGLLGVQQLAQAGGAPGAGSQAQQVGCPGPAVRWQRLDAQTWWFQAADGDTTADNRGLVSNLVVVRDKGRVWLLGAGPSPRAGRALACQLKRVTGWRVTDVMAPWPRPELVLGQSAYVGARLWAHASVAAAMRERCPRCEARLRLRLGRAASDLGPQPIRIARWHLQGTQGRWGPWSWWLLQRADATSVTVFRLRNTPLWVAHGLLWGDGPPDLRDAEPAAMRASLTRLVHLSAADGAQARWMPEQGALLDAGAPQRHSQYLDSLQQAVARAQEQGALETELPDTLSGVPAQTLAAPRHALNWQRMWQLEEQASWPSASKP